MMLIYRGLFGCVLIWSAAWLQRASIWPQIPRTQVVRFFNSGIALLLAFEAFRRLAGVTVSVVQRLDIPFAVLLGVAASQRPRDMKFWLSLLAIGLVLMSLVFSGKINEDPLGLLLALVAVAQTALAALLNKKSADSENVYVILNISNLSCIVVGIAVGLAKGEFSLLHSNDVWLVVLAALSQFIVNYTLVLLLRRHDVTRAQRPFLLSSVLILGLEMLLKHKWFAPLHIAFVLVVVGLVYLITLNNPNLLFRRAQKSLGWRIKSPEETITIS